MKLMLEDLIKVVGNFQHTQLPLLFLNVLLRVGKNSRFFYDMTQI